MPRGRVIADPARSPPGFYDDPRLHCLVAAIRAKRKRLGWTQTKAAVMAHVDRAGYQKFEQNKAQALSLRSLLDVMSALGLQLHASEVNDTQISVNALND